MCIGARVRHGDFHRPIDEGPLGALLAVVVRHIAHYPIRLRGTFAAALRMRTRRRNGMSSRRR
jgi:carbon-monoxide dehydrogenase medium subunit